MDRYLAPYWFDFENQKEFEQTYEDVFMVEEYASKCEKDDPYIIDCGAHIGLSVAYFAKRYPKARIRVFEPNQETLPLLKKNIKRNNWPVISLEEVAVADVNEEKLFFTNKVSEDADKWSINASLVQGEGKFGDQRSGVVVRTIKLDSYLQEHVDILKLDIQGYETVVLEQVAGYLDNVDEIFVEYHGRSTDPRNDLAAIWRNLSANFRNLEVRQEGCEVEIQNAIEEDLHWIILHGWK